MELTLATRNDHKIREIAGLLLGHDVLALPEAVELPPETGLTFAENALIKARAAAEATGGAAIADDSGIAASALGGAPGVRSARFAGERASDQQNLDKLIAAICSGDDRRVEYVCALAYVESDGSERVFEGRCTGQLIAQKRGEGGFGYDPAFVPDELSDGRTMAELSASEKNAISHRGKAVREFVGWFEQRYPADVAGDREAMS